MLDKCVKDCSGQVVLAQKPNTPIILWAAFEVVSLLLHNGWLRTATHDVATGALLLWALLELFQGVNYARRALGLVVLVFVITAL